MQRIVILHISFKFKPIYNIRLLIYHHLKPVTKGYLRMVTSITDLQRIGHIATYTITVFVYFFQLIIK